MLNHPTHDQLQRLRLFGMARALTEQQALPDIASLPFEERLGLLVEREVSERESRLTSSRLRRAKLKQAAVAEDVDYRAVWIAPFQPAADRGLGDGTSEHPDHRPHWRR